MDTDGSVSGREPTRAEVAKMFVENHPDLFAYRDLEDCTVVTNNGHYLRAFLPHGKRRCGILVCLKCRASLCICRLSDYTRRAVQESWCSVVKVPDRDLPMDLWSTDMEDVIAHYFDVECIARDSSPQEVRSLSDLYSTMNFSMHSDMAVRDIAHCLSQSVVRSGRRPVPLSECQNYQLPYEETRQQNDTARSGRSRRQ
eukprot:gb/GECG01014609.1/.p1 GENE.gb/GECG01014609.1/~~gb/GECG01014609.1/.p1  ORF type:complete len:199 (+),score=12.04 gb/GECG01014609.1/:1-597(+)